MKIRKVLSLVLAIALSLTLFACKNSNKEESKYTAPNVTNPATSVLSSTFNENNYSVSKENLFKTVKYYGGLSLLLQQMDEKLLADYILRVDPTSDVYTSRYNRLAYGTSDKYEIGLLTNEEKEKAQQDLFASLTVMGYSTTEKQQAYIKYLVAQDMYTLDYIKKDNRNNTFKRSEYYVTNEDIENYFKKNNHEGTTAKAIVINFNSTNEYRQVLAELGYVTYNSEIRRYTGLDSINEVLPGELNDTNTEAVTDMKGLFIEIYNQVNSSSLFNEADASYNYDDLFLTAPSIATKMFSMAKDEYMYIAKAYNDVDYGTAYTMMYRLDENTVDLTDELKATIVEKIYQQFVEATAGSSSNVYYTNVRKAMVALRSENNIKFYDKYLGAEYKKQDAKVEVVEAGDETALATIDGLTITGDSYLEYVTGGENKANYFLLYAAFNEMAKLTPTYGALYGNNKNNEYKTSLRYTSFVKQLEDEVKDAISKDKDKKVTEESYLYDTYGWTNKEDVIANNLMLNDLMITFIKDSLLEEVDPITTTETVYGKVASGAKFDSTETYYSDKNGTLADMSSYTEGTELKGTFYTRSEVENTYKNYNFNADVLTKATEVMDAIYNGFYNVYSYEIVVFTDKDNDYKKDTEMNSSENQALLTSLYTLIEQKLVENNCKTTTEISTTLKKFVSDYNKSGFNHVDYMTYKAAGFKVSFTSYSNIKYSFTRELNAQYKALWDQGVLDDWATDYYVGNGVIADNTEAHFIVATKGSKTTTPSFVSASTSSEYYPSNNLLDKDADNNNLDHPTVQQFAAYVNQYLNEKLFTGTKAEEIEGNFGYQEYPIPFISTVDYSDYCQELITNHYLSTYFLLLKVAQELSTVDGYQNYTNTVTALNYFLNK